jgi:pimeloyl-ACP methyl ester carboxylesterase
MLLRTDDDMTFDLLDEGRGTAIVLLHPFPFSKEIWDSVAPALASRARVLRLDLRGCGQSSTTPGPYLMETLAGDLADVLDADNINQAVLAGNSIGVMVALTFYRMFAERVLGLALICGRTSADKPQAAQARRFLADTIEREGTAALVEAYRDRIFAPSAYQERPDMVAEACARIRRTNPQGAAALLRGMALSMGASDLFHDVDVPTSVIAGRYDSLIPTEELQAVSRRIAGSHFSLLECGHLAPLEAPEALTPLLIDLLEQVAKSPSITGSRRA